MASKYKVTYEPDEKGWWVASVRAVPGALTQGRSIEQARNRMREALSLLVGDADDAELVDDIRVPGPQRRAINRLRGLQEKAARCQEEAATVARELVHDLRARMSVRDVANLLDLSSTRVHQLAAPKKKAGNAAASKSNKRSRRASRTVSAHRNRTGS